MNYLLLLFFSILPVILVGRYIYKKDSEKEPTSLLIKLFFSGMLSCIVTLLITLRLSFLFPVLLQDKVNLDLISLFFYVFFGIALVEEFSKWLFVYNIGFSSKEFDQGFDIVVYSVFVALGFACFENIFYVLENGIYTAIIRGLLAVPGHACDGVFMGYYLYLSKLSMLSGDMNLKKRYLFLSVLIPMLLHGFYDYCLFSQRIIFILLFFVFIIILYVTTFRKVKKLSKEGLKVRYRDNFCPNCGNKVVSEYCPGCGRKNE